MTWLFLAVRETWRAQAGWVLAIGGAFAAILSLKLIFGVFPALGVPIDVQSPSGHTACASAAYGGLLLLLRGRVSGIATAVLAAAAIGLTRVALDLHTVTEVVIGGAVGVAAVLLLALAPGAATVLRRRDGYVLLALACTLIVVEHGRHADIEPRLHHLEARLNL